MGNFEKVVVLAVLILSAIVLAVSLNDDGQKVEATGPLSAAAERIGQEPRGPVSQTARAREASRPGRGQQAVDAATKPAEEPAGAASNGPGYLLFGELESEPMQGRSATDPVPQAAIPQAAVNADPDTQARILKSTRGLAPSALADFMVYEVVAGDTWNELALRYYGDASRVNALRMANEEGELLEGSKIYVPVYDSGREADRRPLAPASPGQGPARPAASGPATAAPVGGVYVVVSGDSLSRIAVKAYGNGNLWRPIYEANRDQMRSPDWLQVGMRLRIPDPDQPAAAPSERDPQKPRVR